MEKKKYTKPYEKTPCQHRKICKSYLKLYPYGESIWTPHSPACRMRRKRANDFLADVPMIDDLLPQEPHKDELLNLEEVAEKDKKTVITQGYNVKYSGEDSKDFWISKGGAEENIIRVKDETNQLLMKESFTIADFLNNQNTLYAQGFEFYLNESIKSVNSPCERDQTFQLYKRCFENMNTLMKSWVIRYQTIGFFEQGTLMGAATYIMHQHQGKFVMQLLLMGVELDCRQRGIVTKIIDYLKCINKNIVAYADKKALNFYMKLGFKASAFKELNMKEFLLYEDRSTFISYGCEDVYFQVNKKLKKK